MRQNYSGNKRRLEETKRKRREEKRLKKLGLSNNAPGAPAEAPAPMPDLTLPGQPAANSGDPL